MLSTLLWLHLYHRRNVVCKKITGPVCIVTGPMWKVTGLVWIVTGTLWIVTGLLWIVSGLVCKVYWP